MMLRGAAGGAASQSEGGGPPSMPGLPPGLTAHIMTIARGAAAEASRDASASTGFNAERGGGSSSSGGSIRVPPLPRWLQPPSSSSSGAASTHPSGGASDGPTDAQQERIQRLSTAVAGSIFSDLISGALRPGDVGPPPASEKAIRELPRNVCCPAGQSCPICLCEIAASTEGATQMPCKHMYHDACITKWLKQHNTCPVCRHAVEADETPRAPSSLAQLLQGWRARTEGDGTAPAPAPSAGSGSSTSGGPGGGPSGSGQAIMFGLRSNNVNDAPGGSTDANGNPRPPPPTEAELERMTIAELKRRLTSLGVDFNGRASKPELQELLRRASRPQPRLHVQVHMEVVPLPQGMSHRQALEQAARQATDRAMGRMREAGGPAASSTASAPAPSSAAAATNVSSLPPCVARRSTTAAAPRAAVACVVAPLDDGCGRGRAAIAFAPGGRLPAGRRAGAGVSLAHTRVSTPASSRSRRAPQRRSGRRRRRMRFGGRCAIFRVCVWSDDERR